MSMDDDEPLHPLERLKQEAERQRERAEKEAVYCPECDTEVLKDSIEDAIEVAERHDESRHDGDRTARVNGMLIPDFTDEQAQSIQEAVEELRD